MVLYRRDTRCSIRVGNCTGYVGTCSELGEVLAKWDDVHDMKGFARKFDMKLDSVNCTRICSENIRCILHQYKTV